MSILSRLFVGEQKQPELVCWSPETKGHRCDESGKQLIHGDIILDLSIPNFDQDETWVYVVVSNTGRKALGFGAPGIGLVLLEGSKQTILNCKELQTGSLRERRNHQSLVVDGGQRHFEFVAIFDAAQKSQKAEVVIQVNRILASAYLFKVPFDCN